MNWKKIEAWTTLAALVLGAALLLCSVKPAHAEMFSEIGGGLKLAQSEVFETGCRQVLIVDATPGTMFDGEGRQKTVPCGGAQPIFIGCIIGWESENARTRLCWWHLSHWLSGPPFNHDSEITVNCICATHKFSWRRR